MEKYKYLPISENWKFISMIHYIIVIITIYKIKLLYVIW